jgi:hypothetical protein
MKDVMYDLFCMCIILVVHIFLRRGVCVSGVRVFCDKLGYNIHQRFLGFRL